MVENSNGVTPLARKASLRTATWGASDIEQGVDGRAGRDHAGERLCDGRSSWPMARRKAR